MKRITYKHWKKPEVILVREGILPTNMNRNPDNDRWVIKCSDGTWEDILKSTVVKIEEMAPPD